MKRLLITYLLSVVMAPLFFYFYWKHGLVCEPRAVISSLLFGAVPFVAVFAASFEKRKAPLYFAAALLLIEIIVTPIIMINALGVDELMNERLIAFFTFEFFSLLQFVFAALLIKTSRALVPS